MTNLNHQDPASRRALLPRRGPLLASVAAVGIAFAVAVGGASFYLPSTAHAVFPTAQAAEAVPMPQPSGFADLVARVKPAVISVRVQLDQPARTASMEQEGGNQGGNQVQPGSPMDRFFRQFGQQMPNEMPNGMQQAPQQPRHMAAEGSGFFISADGYAVTNNHVVDHANIVQVITDDGHTLKAKVIGTDPNTDLALIKVDKIDGKDFTFVKFADRDPRIGDWVVAVGNPFGLGGTVTAGVVSARGRDIGSGPYDDFIQIDAPINKGNSGGPAFDVEGNVIGVNTAIYSPSGGSVGIGFDIPADTAKMIVAQLKEHGHVTRGWIGVQIQAVTPDIADSLGMKKVAGALVDEPQAGSPAAKAGIVAGDVITGVDGKDVKGNRELARRIAAMAPGTTVQLAVLHGGAEKSMSLTLGTLPDQRQANADTGEQGNPDSATPRLGLTLAPADQVDGVGKNGVAVTAVDPNGPAAEHGVRAGDVILDIGGKAVSKPGDVRQQLSDLRKEGKNTVLLRMKSGNATKFVAIPLGKA
jgi:serine protease Do